MAEREPGRIKLTPRELRGIYRKETKIDRIVGVGCMCRDVASGTFEFIKAVPDLLREMLQPRVDPVEERRRAAWVDALLKSGEPIDRIEYFLGLRDDPHPKE